MVALDSQVTVIVMLCPAASVPLDGETISSSAYPLGGDTL
jgi:hypothetical protein